MTKKELLEMLDVQCDHKDRCEYYHDKIDNLLIGVDDNVEIVGVSMLRRKEYKDNNTFAMFLKAHDKAYVEQQLYALSCSVADFAMQYAEVDTYKEVYERRKNSWFSVFRNIALVALIAVAIAFTVLEENNVINTNGLVATVIGTVDLCFGVISYLVERWSDEKKDREAFAGANRTRTRIEDKQDNLEEKYEERIQPLIVVIDQSQHTTIYDEHSETKVEQSEENYTEVGQVIKITGDHNTVQASDPETKKAIEEHTKAIEANTKATKELFQKMQSFDELRQLVESKQSVKDKEELFKRSAEAIDNPKDISSTLCDVVGDTREIAARFKDDSDIVAACNKVADDIAEISEKQDVDRKSVDIELLLYRMQIYFDAMRMEFNDIYIGKKGGFANVKEHREIFVSQANDCDVNIGMYALRELEGCIKSVLRPDPEDAKREADVMLDEFAKKYGVVDAECASAIQDYFDALRMEFNYVCVGDKGGFEDVKEHRENLLSQAYDCDVNIDMATLRDLESRIKSVLHPDAETAKRNADRILEDYKNKIITQCKA